MPERRQPGNPHTQAQWEIEVERDEKRIHSYFAELLECLDLPGEEEMINRKLSSRADLRPADGYGPRPDDDGSWKDDGDDGGFDGKERGYSRRPGESVVEAVDQLAVEWNIICATVLAPELKQSGMQISCELGKLLARTADFIDTDEVDERPLKIVLGKRALRDLGELASRLSEVTQKQPEIGDALAGNAENLMFLQNQISSMIASLRRQ